MISAGAVESRCSSPVGTAATSRIADRPAVQPLAIAAKVSRQDRATGLHPAPVPAAIAVRANRPAQRNRHHPQPVRAAVVKVNRPARARDLHPAVRTARGVTVPSETWGPAERPTSNLSADERASVALDMSLPVAAAAAWGVEGLEADAAAVGAAVADGGPT